MKKKLFHGIIAAVIFIALVIGVNLSTGFTAIVAVIALVLHSVQTVWLFGREWKSKKDDTEIPTGFVSRKEETKSVKNVGDHIKNVEE